MINYSLVLTGLMTRKMMGKNFTKITMCHLFINNINFLRLVIYFYPKHNVAFRTKYFH